jgi:uncharacterized SAM-binding protein YcdF (DUF218 family)
MPSPVGPLFRVIKWLIAVAVVIALCLLLWGGDLLIASDPLPEHVDAAIVLQGSIAAEKVRIAGAIDLLRQGVADRALLSVPKESYWGQSIPPVARTYLEHNYGTDLTARVDFCEMGEEVNSTWEEAQAVRLCIQERHWQSIVIVTSNYHTRRSGIIWRNVTKNDPKTRIFIRGVIDPEFQQPWWRHRQSAKVWVLETTKLVWMALGGR